MPICKNDPKKTYKGNEPSPKGLGYCAHVEKLGVIRKGKDGNKWKIEAICNKILFINYRYMIIKIINNFNFLIF